MFNKPELSNRVKLYGVVSTRLTRHLTYIKNQIMGMDSGDGGDYA